MAKRFNKDDAVYFPVKIAEVEYEDRWYDYVVRGIGADGTKDGFPFCVKDEEVKTAEEVVKENYPFWDGVRQMDRITAMEAENASLKESLHEASEENLANDEALAQMNIKKAELEAENEKLKQQLADASELLSDAQEKVRELTEADCMRVQEFKPIIEERDRLKAEVATRTENVKNLVEENDQLKKLADGLGDENEKLKAENEQEKKRTQVWKDSSEEHRQRAEELEGDVRRYEQDISEVELTVQKLTKENDSLKADILELRAQIDVFRPDPKEIEALKKRINMLEKLKEVHIRVIRRSTRRLKEKDFVISALVEKGIELEEGGESNG